jgi:single-strand DNA-binding protein
MYVNRIFFRIGLLFALLNRTNEIRLNLNPYLMNTLRNKVQLIGNLGNAPEIITLDSGKKLAKFSIATNDTYKNAQGEKVQDTQWHNIVAWNKTAEIVEKYLDKGKEVAIEGKLTTRSYDDKEGNKRYITEVVCNELLMLGSK